MGARYGCHRHAAHLARPARHHPTGTCRRTLADLEVTAEDRGAEGVDVDWGYFFTMPGTANAQGAAYLEQVAAKGLVAGQVEDAELTLFGDDSDEPVKG